MVGHRAVRGAGAVDNGEPFRLFQVAVHARRARVNVSGQFLGAAMTRLAEQRLQSSLRADVGRPPRSRMRARIRSITASPSAAFRGARVSCLIPACERMFLKLRSG